MIWGKTMVIIYHFFCFPDFYRSMNQNKKCWQLRDIEGANDLLSSGCRFWLVLAGNLRVRSKMPGGSG